MRVLVLGAGAREHALIWKLAQSPEVDKIYAMPGNAGIEQVAERIPLPNQDVDDLEKYVDAAKRVRADLTIVGPERLLVDGVVDRFQKSGLTAFGPTHAAAQLEGSKIWAKQLMQRVGIPTASWRDCYTRQEAESHAELLGWRCVIKTDGLAEGKGSFVCTASSSVDHALSLLFDVEKFGHRPVVVEELLDGQEISVFAISDGVRVLPFGAAQDHKRAQDHDAGPNTGGMGAYSPVRHMRVAQEFATAFFDPIVQHLAANNTPYCGVLYAGAIITADGPRILEFNCRFGDPEAEALLPRLSSDLLPVLNAASRGELHKIEPPTWSGNEAVCVVVSTEKYPGESDYGTPINGLESAEAVDGVVVFHAGTERNQQTHGVVTAGGRIFAVTGLGSTVAEAQSRAYDAVRRISFHGMHYRHDIGDRGLAAASEPAWSTELRKPPRWERVASDASTELAAIANELEGLALRRFKNGPQLRELTARLYEARRLLHATTTDDEAAQIQARAKLTSDELSQLTRFFDEIVAQIADADATRLAEGFARHDVAVKLRLTDDQSGG